MNWVTEEEWESEFTIAAESAAPVSQEAPFHTQAPVTLRALALPLTGVPTPEATAVSLHLLPSKHLSHVFRQVKSHPLLTASGFHSLK